MVDHNKIQKILKGYISHIVALVLIGTMVYLLFKSAFNTTITVPDIILSLGSGAVGFYLSNFKKEN